MDKLVEATVSITFLVTDDHAAREDPRDTVRDLIREMMTPHVHSKWNWANRFVIATAYTVETAEPKDD